MIAVGNALKCGAGERENVELQHSVYLIPLAHVSGISDYSGGGCWESVSFSILPEYYIQSIRIDYGSRTVNKYLQ
jgi:hypothetical protein